MLKIRLNSHVTFRPIFRLLQGSNTLCLKSGFPGLSKTSIAFQVYFLGLEFYFPNSRTFQDFQRQWEPWLNYHAASQCNIYLNLSMFATLHQVIVHVKFTFSKCHVIIKKYFPCFHIARVRWWKYQTIVWREYVFAANKSSSDGVLPILILKSNVSSVDPSSERNTRETRCQHMSCTVSLWYTNMAAKKLRPK